MRTKLKPLVLAAAAALSAAAHAGDKEVLDLLVKKGVITAEERAKAIQESKVKDAAANLNEVFIKEDAAKRLTLSGRVQVQYEGAQVESTGSTPFTKPAGTNDFILRRVYLGAKADVGDGFSGELVWNFADGSNGGEFDKMVFTAETRYGKFDLGYQKVQWGQEENTSSSKLPWVERSLVTRYWAESNNGRRLGFAARHTGIHYSNREILGEGGQGTLNYGLSLVRSDHNANFSSNISAANDLGVYAFASVEWKPIGLTAGLNVAENKHSGQTTDATTLDDDHVRGYNPYLRWVSGDLTVLADFMDTEVKAGATTRDPSGYNLTAVLKASEKLEYVIRYSALDTDGRGVRVSDGLRNVNGPSTNFNEMDSLYVGVNYYFIGDNAKIQAGYEAAQFETANGATKGKADVFRVQVQVLF